MALKIRKKLFQHIFCDHPVLDLKIDYARDITLSPSICIVFVAFELSLIICKFVFQKKKNLSLILDY